MLVLKRFHCYCKYSDFAGLSCFTATKNLASPCASALRIVLPGHNSDEWGPGEENARVLLQFVIELIR